MCTHDLNGILLTVNLAAARTLGYEPSELVNRNLRELLSPQIRAELDAYLALISEKGAASGFMRLQTKSGETRIWKYANTLRTEGVQVPFVRGMAHDVTEILLTQKALRKSAERLSVAAEVGRMYAWEWDCATDTVWRSAESAGILGFSDNSQQSIAEDYFSLVHPDDRVGLCNLAKRLTPKDPGYRTVYRRFRPDGGLLWLEESGRATFDQAGNLIRLVGMTADITQRKETEEKLRASEERYRRIVETTNEGVWLLDSTLHNSYVNRQMAEMLGYEPKEMVGLSVFDFYFPEDVERKKEVLVRRQQGLREQIEERLRRKDGSELWVRLAATPICKDNGDFDGAMAIVSDITQQRLAEKGLRESEERFRLMANSAPVMIWMSGTDKRPDYFNQTWLDFTGRSLDTEREFGLAAITHPDEFERCRKIYNEAFDSRRPFRKECRLRRHDGEYRWVLDAGEPRFLSDGSFAGYIGCCVDVTDHKLAEQALYNVNRRLIEAQEEERTRIARELHDDICQRIALLAVRLDDFRHGHPKSLGQLRRELGQASEEAQDLAADVQALSHRLHSSKLKHLGLAAAAAGFCKEFSEQQGMEIDFQSGSLPEQLPEEISLCLFRVLQEAVQNAAKHSGSRHFQVSLRNGSNEIELKIHDSGIGFEPEVASNQEGLGLTSMRERMKLVNGELSIESGLQRGTTVCARVPHNPQVKSVKAG